MPHPTVPATFVDPKLIDPKNRSSERYKFLSDNCIKLAEFLTDLPARFHHQSSWASPRNNACGTTGCALGWAAMSHICDGLQFQGEKVSNQWIGVTPTINGQPANWDRAMCFFIPALEDPSYWFEYGEVFGPHGNKVEVINKLYRIAEHLCEKAKQAKAHEQRQRKAAPA